jgi:NAD(P)-dependent dehydrogenase (short-subunit alcohol dehydrogenase family)
MLRDLFDLTGKTALITGASRGMGLAIARAMGDAGAAVVVSGNEAEECEAAAANLRAAGIDALAIPCDVAAKAEVEAPAARALAWRGAVDALVCNAGIAPHMGPLATATDTDWDLTMTVNLRSMLWLVVDDGEVRLPPGDIVVQRGTNHAWSDRTEETARIAFILVDGRFGPGIG